jgi:hypothetical protein
MKIRYHDYKQEQAGESIHAFFCAHCKVDVDYINGRLERHLPSCDYRIHKEKSLAESQLNQFDFSQWAED